MEIVLIIIIVIAFIWSKNNSAKELEEKKKKLREQNKDNLKLKDTIVCPQCYSTQNSANKRGITITTGLIGSQTVYVTCLQCGYKWRAGGK